MDYKEAIQERADELAMEKYDKEFYDLDKELQFKVYQQATEDYADDLASQIDSMKDREKYKGVR